MGAEIIWTGQRFLIAGRFREGLLTSVDGRDWSLIPNTARLGVIDFAWDHAVPLAQIADTTVGILVFTTFLPGERIPFIRSTDHGQTWAQGWLPQPPKNRSNPYPSYAALVSHRNLFIAAGSNGMIATSEDGLRWTRRAARLSSSEIRHLASNGRAVVASAYDVESDNFQILHSPDGLTWAEVNMEPIRQAIQNEFNYDKDLGSLYIRNIFADGSRLVAGIEDLFFASEDGLAWSLLELGSSGQSQSSAITISRFGNEVTADGWTWNGSQSRLTGTDAPRAVLYPETEPSLFDFTLLGDPSDLYLFLSASVVTAPFGEFSISLEDKDGRISANRFGWGWFAEGGLTIGLPLDAPDGFLWSNIVGWTLDAGGRGEPVDATFTRLTVGSIANPGSSYHSFISPYSVTWMGQFDGATHVLDDRGGIGRIEPDGVTYVGEAGQDPLSGSGMSIAGLALPSQDVDVVISVSGNSSNYSVSTSGNGFVERDFGNNLRPIAVSRIGDRLVIAARSTSDWGSKETDLYASSNGLDWIRAGAGLFDGEDLSLVGASVDSGPLLLAAKRTDYDSDNNSSTTTLRLYRSVGRLNNWQPLSIPEPSSLPVDPNSSLEPDIQWDGQRFILRNTSGELWHSTGGATWSKLPSLPDDSKNFLLATVWSPLTVKESGEQLQKNYAGFFTSNGNRLVVRPAKLERRSGRLTSGGEFEDYWWWEQWGGDVFFVYDFDAPTAGWRRVVSRRLDSYPVSYAEMVWTGTNFVAATEAGRISTSPDGIQWTQRELGADVQSLHWTGSRLVATNWRGGALTHPTGLSRDLAEPKDRLAAAGLGLFATSFEGGFYLYEIVQGEARVDDAVLLRDTRNRELTFSSLARLIGGLMAFYFEDEPLPVPLPGTPDMAIEREGRLATIRFSDFNLRSGAFLGVRRLQVDLDTGVVTPLPMLLPSQLADILAAETRFDVDFNADGLVGDGVSRDLGGGLYASASGALYYSSNPQELGRPVPSEAVMLRDARGNPLSAAVFSRSFPLMDQGGGAPGVIFSDTTLQIAVPNYALPRGATGPAFASLTIYNFEPNGKLITTQTLLPARQLPALLAAETAFDIDFNRDGVVGDGVSRDLGGDLYVTASGALYHSVVAETAGTPASSSATLLSTRTGVPYIAASFAPNNQILPLTTSQVASKETASGVLQVAIPRFNMQTRNRVVGMNTLGQPELPRFNHSQVWTGRELIVWGGGRFELTNLDETTTYGDGAAYNPATDTWRAISRNRAPSPRAGHSAVWTGQEMIVWGGSGDRTLLPNSEIVDQEVYQDGAIYHPESDTWRPMPAPNKLLFKSGHTAIWTGVEMIVWGSDEGDNIGAAYDPAENTWREISSSGAPSERIGHGAVWTGKRMAIWGGSEMADPAEVPLPGSGAFYDPDTNSWEEIAVEINKTPWGGDGSGAEDGERGIELLWTGDRLLAFPINSLDYSSGNRTPWIHRGGAYHPDGQDGQKWSPIETTGATNVRPYMAAHTRDGRLFAGGSMNNSFNGLAYDFGTRRWSRIMNATTGSFQGRQGTWAPERDEMLVFGGMWANTTFSFSGGRNGNRGFRLQLNTPVFASLAIHEFNYFSGRLIKSTTLTSRQITQIHAAEIEFDADLNGDGFIGRPPNPWSP